MAALLFVRLSRRLQPPCAALLIVSVAQLCGGGAHPTSHTAVRGALATAPQMAPERS